jgi:hypothetical protein
MMPRTVTLLLLVSLLLPLGAMGQAEGSAEARIQAAMQRARSAGLPVELLESKVNEGHAKNVPHARIAAAVEQRLESLTRARAVMRGAPELTTTDLSVGADALEAGVGEGVLASLSRSARADQRAAAVAVLTQLVRVGEAPAVALDRVDRALRQGPAALQRLSAEAAARQRRRGPPEEMDR